MSEFPYLYRNSRAEARRQGELEMWQKSHLVNVDCRKAIEEAISEGFSGEYLDENCAQSVIDRYGFKRVNYVLANTLQRLRRNERINEGYMQWGEHIFIPPDAAYNREFAVRCHPHALENFVAQSREAYQALGLFGPEHCVEDGRGLDYTGKVLVLSPDTLKESCWSAENMLWLAEGGFGCSPTATGRAVYATCLGDGEQTRWDRADFTGILKDEFLPDWAQEKLEELRGQKQSGPSMDGMG